VPDRDLRTRKKLATRHSLATAARDLTLERGLDSVTVDDITEAAGVSPRTFFNYFSCKEEAIVGADPTLLAAITDAVEHRPADEDPLAALLAVLGAAEDAHLARRWAVRAELTHRHPELLPRYLAGLADLERSLTGAVARRVGTNPTADPYPRLVVAAAVSALRATFEWWEANGHSRPLGQALRDAFGELASGLAPGEGG
jgi:AcrR family transcriptional regulator